MAMYHPMLRWKRGERIGLRNLHPQYKLNVTPVFLLSDGQYKPKQSTSTSPQLTEAQNFVEGITSDWGFTPIYVDASLLSIVNQQHEIVYIVLEAANRNITAIPTTNLYANYIYQNSIVSIHSSTNTDIALRISLQDLFNAQAWLNQWPIPKNKTDLIIDLGNSIAEGFQYYGQILATIQYIQTGTPWKSITLTGTSIPDNFGNYAQNQNHLIHRGEIDLWNSLQTNLNTRLDFGDYATVPLNAPGSGIAWGFPINAKYTLPADFLICRGVTTTRQGAIDMDVQLRGHASSIKQYQFRNRLNCWADDMIDNIANGIESPGNLETWVQIGVCRHIAITRHSLP
ncbi:beta family protein [Elstera cyanobacteriorum]|uniref:beta family protein n=1 Tax=Elstera cyanobacteriorum TaxID=2022747 RepID=UPI0023547344|nr:hypothetical protein [Elstera cyanobacteriorum]MCK6442294.1 beta family protein [Elstera cyanobacteriorum]